MSKAKQLAPLTDEQRGIVAAYAKLAPRFASRVRTHLEDDDASQEAAVGIMDAARRFDPATGNQFSTFAAPRARGAVRDAARNCGTIKVGRHGRDTSSVDAQRAMRVGPIRCHPVDHQTSVPEQASRREWHERFHHAVSQLSDRDQAIVAARLAGKSMRATGKLAGCSESWVCKVEHRLIQVIGDTMGLRRGRETFGESA